MPILLNEIEWGEPILPVVDDKKWEKQVRRELGGPVTDLLMIVTPSEWLRLACLRWPRYKVTQFSQRLADIATLVTAQENACRYCYGIARSQLKLFGYSEKLISRIEKGLQLAELDEKERTFIQFCRNLARSSPRPPKKERQRLIELGFSELAVAEMAFYIANHCFVNRTATFISCPLFHKLEWISDNFLGKLFRPIIAKQIRKTLWQDIEPLPDNLSNFSGVIRALKGLPAAKVINDAMTGAFESEVLSKELKILMFAVVARSLECQFCITESKYMASQLGIEEQEFEYALTSLSSPRLNDAESRIFTWTRETVHFETGDIQRRIRSLSTQVDDLILLEAIGVAALANTVVRLAVLLE
jgi:alkylhydroperoxidase family enzyme